jgi:antirestriction protein ArdC
MHEKKDPYQLVTDRIVEALEAGVVPWHRPWKTLAGGGPTSLSTGKPYRGVNVFTLGVTEVMRGYESSYWTTFQQAKERGGMVRKGEKSTPVVFWKAIEKRDDAGNVTEKFGFLRYFSVFNAEQCDGLTLPVIEEPEPNAFEPIARAEAIADHMPKRPTVKHGGDRAYYSPGLDYVQIPLQVAFETPTHYYGTLFHELVHATGHDSRLGRGLTALAPFGSPDYSKEELVAEMGAAYLCGAAGIEPDYQHHAGYLESWLRALKNDRKLLVSAAGKAQRAAAYIVGEPEPEPTS